MAVLGTMAQDSPVFRSESALMELEVRVTRRGQPVTGLTAESFTVLENKKAQKVAFVEYVPGPRAAAERLRQNPNLRAGQGERIEPVYILIRRSAGAGELYAVHQAIREFIEKNLLPGVQISIDGLPFTSRKEELLAVMDALDRRLKGEKRADLALMNRTGMLDDAMRAERQSTLLLNELYSLTDVVPTSPNAPAGAGPQALSGVGPASYNPLGTDFSAASETNMSQRLVETQMRFFQRQSLRSYVDLMQTLGGLRGRKIIVLFQGSFRVNWADSADLLDRIRTEALRQRVSIYTVDARGLVTNVGLADNPGSAQMAAITVAERAGMESGLMTLADLTGGRYVGGTNNFDLVFQRIYDDLDGYYVLGYYPEDSSKRGRERKIEVKVAEAGTSLAYRKVYFEREEWAKLSDKEKQAELLSALQAESYTGDFPLSVTVDSFLGEDHKTVAVLTVGIPAREVNFVARGNIANADVRLALQLFAEGATVPTEVNQVFREEYSTRRLAELKDEPFEFLQHYLQIPLTPGNYRLSVVLRDESDGRTGAYRVKLQAPDLATCMAPSSLLLTRYVKELKPAEGDAGDLDFLRWANVRLLPDSSNVVRRGQRLYGLFEVNQLDRDAAASGGKMRLQMRRGAEFLKEIPLTTASSYKEAQKKARFFLDLDTSTLDEGVYALYATFERGDTPERVTAADSFVVVSGRSPAESEGSAQ
jgi:VWFA-related protein